MKKRSILFIGMFALLTASILLFSACPPAQKLGPTPELKKPDAQKVIEKDKFKPAPEGKTLKGYIIKWTDATGKEQKKEVSNPEDVVLEGGIQAGSNVTIIQVIINEDETTTEVSQEPVQPGTSSDWRLYVQAGITHLEKQEWDAALAKFDEAYRAEQNNTTKTYYALVKLAAISTKPATVAFMKNRMGFETYPGTLNALVKLDWFKDYELNEGSFGTHYSDFKEDEHDGGYIRVKGHIIDEGADTQGKPAISLSNCYERSTISGFTKDWPREPINPQPQWVEAGAKALYDHLKALPVKNRERYYYVRDWQKTKQLVIDEISDSGNFMVWHSSNIPEGTKRYSQDTNSGWAYLNYEVTERLPQVKEADWYKAMHPILYIPAYLLEHQSEANIDTLIDELYAIVFGAEYTKAKELLNSLDAAQPVTIDKKLLKLIHLDEAFGKDTDAKLQKAQLLGIVGTFTLVQGGFEFIQSYSFNTDLSMFKFDWMNVRFDKGLAEKINGYDQKMDPFNNGFLKGRSAQKLQDAKAHFIEGADILIGLYDSFIDDANMPQKARDAVKDYTYIKMIVKEIRDAIHEGRKANILVGENNALTHDFKTFELDMGKIFTYEYFKLSNTFEMNGTKPKIYPAEDGKPAYMQMKYKDFLNDFMKIVVIGYEWNGEKHIPNGKSYDISEEWDGKIPLEGELGAKIQEFYK